MLCWKEGCLKLLKRIIMCKTPQTKCNSPGKRVWRTVRASSNSCISVAGQNQTRSYELFRTMTDTVTLQNTEYWCPKVRGTANEHSVCFVPATTQRKVTVTPWPFPLASNSALHVERQIQQTFCQTSSALWLRGRVTKGAKFIPPEVMYRSDGQDRTAAQGLRCTGLE